MPVRQIFAMQNDFEQQFGGGGVAAGVRQDALTAEGICTVTALVWAKRCLELGRGIGSYAELGLSDHQRNALMAVWRRYDNDPHAQTHGMGLRIAGTGDRTVTGVRVLQGVVANTAPHVAIFYNSFHTMGYRVGAGRGNSQEFEWFDNNHGYFVSDSASDMYDFMSGYMEANYGETVSGVRVVQL